MFFELLNIVLCTSFEIYFRWIHCNLRLRHRHNIFWVYFAWDAVKFQRWTFFKGLEFYRWKRDTIVGILIIITTLVCSIRHVYIVIWIQYFIIIFYKRFICCWWVIYDIYKFIRWFLNRTFWFYWWNNRWFVQCRSFFNILRRSHIWHL